MSLFSFLLFSFSLFELSFRRWCTQFVEATGRLILHTTDAEEGPGSCLKLVVLTFCPVLFCFIFVYIPASSVNWVERVSWVLDKSAELWLCAASFVLWTVWSLNINKSEVTDFNIFRLVPFLVLIVLMKIQNTKWKKVKQVIQRFLEITNLYFKKWLEKRRSNHQWHDDRWMEGKKWLDYLFCYYILIFSLSEH